MLLLLALVLALRPGRAAGQDRPAPFETLTLRAGVGAPVYESPTLASVAQPGVQGHVGVEAPFYRGRIGLDVAAHRMASTSAPAPDFTGVSSTLGWGLTAPLLPRVRGYAGLGLGLYLMAFEAPRGVSPKSPYETEMTVVPTVRLEADLGRGWGLQLDARYAVVYTLEPLRFASVRASVCQTFAAPSWLRRFLQ